MAGGIIPWDPGLPIVTSLAFVSPKRDLTYLPPESSRRICRDTARLYAPLSTTTHSHPLPSLQSRESAALIICDRAVLWGVYVQSTATETPLGDVKVALAAITTPRLLLLGIQDQSHRGNDRDRAPCGGWVGWDGWDRRLRGQRGWLNCLDGMDVRLGG